MSAPGITSILLPAAHIDFFVKDDAQAQALVKDWRFARTKIQIEKAGIDAAIARYTQAPSPELIVIETDDVGDDFIKQLAALAGVCPAGTDAIVIGPHNDVRLYRSLVEMGVRDYLVRPVSEEDLVKVVARALVAKKGTAGSRLVAVIGGKGGVGATSLAQVLAWVIAEELKMKTLLMDTVGSAGSIGISYGLEPATTHAEAVRLGAGGSEDDMKRICQDVTPQLSVLVCGGEPLLSDAPSVDGIEALVSRVMKKYPVVVVDLSSANPAIQKRLLSLAAAIAVVTAPTLSSLRNAKSLLNEIKVIKSTLDAVDLVVNMQGVANAEEVPVKDMPEALGAAPLAVVPHAPKIFVASEVAGKPVGQNKAAENIIESLIPLAEKVSGAKRATVPKKKGFLDKLTGR